MEKESLKVVPKKPGVYLWKDNLQQVIYIGKAKNLFSRMHQYFKGSLNSYKTFKLLKEITSFEYIITSSEKDALILERNLIEKYLPKYNILLTDFKHYPYIRILLKDTLKIDLVYKIKSENNKYSCSYGPFPSGFFARNICKFLNRAFNFENGLPIQNKDVTFWQKQFQEAKKLINYDLDKLKKRLKDSMWKAAENNQYELAQDFKETLEGFAIFSKNSTIELNNYENLDVISFFEKDKYLFISFLFYRNGTLFAKKDFVQEIFFSKKETIEEFVEKYYLENLLPTKILTNESFAFTTKIVVPKKGKLLKLVNLALENAKDNVELKIQKFIRQEEITINATQKLASLLNLPKVNHILMIDNSNTKNYFPVSSIVSYRNGIKRPNEYRKYKIENEQKQGDTFYMQKGLEKYFKNEQNPIPDLLIVDGGINQINASKKIVKSKVPIIGLVKNNKHKTDFLIDLKMQKQKIEDKFLFSFLENMQQEVDRYAKSYHNFRKSKTLEGVLKTIKGIGSKTEAKLLAHFQNYANIYNASLDQLSNVVSLDLAKLIKSKMKN